jgi:hypothetical protein
MAMETDVSAKTLTADGTIYGARTRVKSISYLATTTAGSVKLKDGGASGTVLIDIATPAVADAYEVVIPAQGVLFETDVYLDLTDVASVTVFYG